MIEAIRPAADYPPILARLMGRLLALWAWACRHAERPDRYVPRY
jgi:hypothetical protein